MLKNDFLHCLRIGSFFRLNYSYFNIIVIPPNVQVDNQNFVDFDRHKDLNKNNGIENNEFRFCQPMEDGDKKGMSSCIELSNYSKDKKKIDSEVVEKERTFSVHKYVQLVVLCTEREGKFTQVSYLFI